MISKTRLTRLNNKTAAVAAVLLLLLCFSCSTFRSPPTSTVPFISEQDIEKTFSQLVTLPIDKKKPLETFTFSSCATQIKPQPIWKVALSHHPQVHLNLGDNIYASRPEERPLRKIYALQARDPNYVEFRSIVPQLATWDDHDFGLNDGGEENPEASTAREQFLQFYPNDAALIPASQSKGIYHAVNFGPNGRRTQIIFLDTRSFRSALEKNKNPKHELDIYQPTQDLSKTIVGREQWIWLEEQFKKPAELRILISSIQLLPEDHGFEKWMNFPHERGKLFSILRKNKIQNLLILSGDRHHSEVSQAQILDNNQILRPQNFIKNKKTTLITEVTASGINKTSNLLSENNRYRIGEKYNLENFGLANIDWKHRVLKVEIRDTQNEIKIQHQIVF